mmetsp:Transcript_267/g.2126  ORF Transcript_267/g.2126 Transcript_267/m.2126 type:complete len:89 (+) Transcript_267:167-433(+)
MLGLDAAGKTTILYKLHIGEVLSTVPTIGEKQRKEGGKDGTPALGERIDLFEACIFIGFQGSWRGALASRMQNPNTDLRTFSIHQDST